MKRIDARTVDLTADELKVREDFEALLDRGLGMEEAGLRLKERHPHIGLTFLTYFVYSGCHSTEGRKPPTTLLEAEAQADLLVAEHGGWVGIRDDFSLTYLPAPPLPSTVITQGFVAWRVK